MSTTQLTKGKAIIKEFKMRLPEIMKLDPRVSITIGDGDYVLIVDNQAMIDFFKDTGVNLLGEGLKASQLDDPLIIGHLLHRAAQRYNPNTTLEWANASINPRQYLYIRGQILLCLDAFMPDMADIDKSVEVTEEEQNPT